MQDSNTESEVHCEDVWFSQTCPLSEPYVQQIF